MLTARQARKITELAIATKEWECTRREALLEFLFNFYEATGFARAPLSTELENMSEEDLMEIYLNI